MLSTDIRSRSNAEILRSAIRNSTSKDFELDMSGVSFISRSFADEVCEIISEEKERNISVINATGYVKSMLEVVKRSRSTKRIYGRSDSDVVMLKDMHSLSDFFATI